MDGVGVQEAGRIRLSLQDNSFPKTQGWTAHLALIALHHTRNMWPMHNAAEHTPRLERSFT
jgi:hypothetical protein